MIPGNATWDDAVAKEGYDPIVLVEIAGNTNWYFSTRPLVVAQGAGYDDYRPLVKSTSIIDQALAEGLAGVSIISQFKLTLANTDPILSNTVASTGLAYDSLEGKELIVKYGFATQLNGLAFTLSNFITVFTGEVTAYPNNESVMTNVAQDKSRNIHKDLPTETVDSANAHPDAASEFVPITYGDLDQAAGLITDLDLDGQVVKFDTKPVDSSFFNDAELFAWDKDFSKLIPVSNLSDDGSTGAPEWSFSDANAEATFDAATRPYAERGKALFLTMFDTMRTLVTVAPTGAITISNPDNALTGDGQEDLSTFCRVDENATPSSKTYINYLVNAVTKLGELVKLYMLAKYTTTIEPTGKREGPAIQINPSESFTGGGHLESTALDRASYLSETIYAERPTITGPLVTSFNNLDGADNIGDSDLINMAQTNLPSTDTTRQRTRWKRDGMGVLADAKASLIFASNSGIAALRRVDLYALKFLAVHTLDFKETPKGYLYGIIGGRVYGAWTARTSTDVVSEATDVVQAVFRHELGLATADIDTASFDDAQTNLAITHDGDFTLAGQVLKKVNSRDLVGNMCKQIRARQYQRYDGTEALKVRGVAGASQASFTVANIVKGSFTKDKQPLSEVYNEFYINWHKNPATGKYDEVAFATADDSNYAGAYTSVAALKTACSDSQSRYNTVERYTLDADWIRTKEDADALLARVVIFEELTKAKTLATFKTPLKDGWAVELTDLIDITYTWLPPDVNGGKFELTRKRFLVDKKGIYVELTGISLLGE